MKTVVFYLKFFIVSFIIFIYKLFFWPVIIGRCRFSPSCSEYFLEIFKKHSLSNAFFLMLRRLYACFFNKSEIYAFPFAKPLQKKVLKQK